MLLYDMDRRKQRAVLRRDVIKIQKTCEEACIIHLLDHRDCSASCLGLGSVDVKSSTFLIQSAMDQVVVYIDGTILKIKVFPTKTEALSGIITMTKKKIFLKARNRASLEISGFQKSVFFDRISKVSKKSISPIINISF